MNEIKSVSHVLLRAPVLLLFLLVIHLLPLAFAQSAADIYTMSEDDLSNQEDSLYTSSYLQLPKQSDAPAEVVEFFYYGCPHCFRAEKMVSDLRKDLVSEGKFQVIQVPAVFPKNEKWVEAAQLYYTAQSLGVEKDFTPKYFQAIHVAKKPLGMSTALPIFESLGVSSLKVKQVMRSFGVKARVQSAIRLTSMANLNGVPHFVVNQTYHTNVEMAGGYSKLRALITRLKDLNRP